MLDASQNMGGPRHGNRLTHGMSKTPTYLSWIEMRRRCNDPRPRNVGYANYGARGIKVCDRWQHSFENFLADMGEKPTAQHSVERRDNDLGYEPTNCYWLLKSGQSENRRGNIYLEVDGTSVSSKEAARRIGMSYYKLRYWLKAGRSLDEIRAMP